MILLLIIKSYSYTNPCEFLCIKVSLSDIFNAYFYYNSRLISDFTFSIFGLENLIAILLKN